MKTRSITFQLPSRAITFTVWEDLGCLKVTKSFIAFIGWEHVKNIRVSAMERMNNTLVTIGPVAVSISKFYLREEE